MNYNTELLNKLQEIKEWYLQGLIDLDEVVRYSARAGIEITEKITKEVGGNYEQI
jgi:hypothetical protein